MSNTFERLMAFVDGQVDAAESAPIRAALQVDGALQAKEGEWRAQSQALRAAFDPILEEHVPERLRAQVAPQAEVLRFPSWRAHWRGLAIGAGALAAAALLGFQFGTGNNEGLLRSTPEGVRAKGALAQALERQASGPAAGKAVAIAFTLTAQDGAPCRAFRVPDQGLDGLACRAEAGWSVIALGTQTKGAPASFRPAAGLSAGVLAALDGLQGSDTLDADAEAARIKAKWR